MATATVRVPQPEIEKGRPARRPLSKFISSNANEDSLPIGSAQYPVYVQRIIATHWLRAEIEEAHHG